jgi:hypothetical protein
VFWFLVFENNFINQFFETGFKNKIFKSMFGKSISKNSFKNEKMNKNCLVNLFLGYVL